MTGINEMTMGSKIATYLDLKAKEKALKAELKALEDAIKAGMGDAQEVRENGFVARYELSTSRKFDTTKFKQDHNDIYEAYRKDVVNHTFQAFVEG